MIALLIVHPEQINVTQQRLGHWKTIQDILKLLLLIYHEQEHYQAMRFPQEKSWLWKFLYRQILLRIGP